MTDTHHTEFRLIGARHLSLSPLNVRKTATDSGIDTLADLIAAEGVLQNLNVYDCPEGEGKKKTTHAVIGGGRRWRALQQLIKQKRIKPDHPVPCSIVSYERALQISLAENSGREPMHPADEFEAFRQLVDAGQSVEDVAARFGVTPLVVQRRLKLANVAPQFIAMYRKKEVALEHLMALAITDDHECQQQVWTSLKTYNRHPDALRRALTEGEVPTRDSLARFVGLKAYTKAGGSIRRDLFSEKEEGYLTDSALLRQLATEKLAKHAESIKEEGHAWIEVHPTLDYADLSAFGHVKTILRDSTDEERARLDAIELQKTELEAQTDAAQDNEEQLDALSDRADALEAEEERLNEQRTLADPDQQAASGAIVSIDHDGKLRIHRGLLKPEDAKRFARADKLTAKEALPRTHSEALVRRLTAHRTLALQAVLAERLDVALVALAHRLAIQTFFPFDQHGTSALQINAHNTPLAQYAPDLEDSKAHRAFEAKREALKRKLPPKPESLFEWLLTQPQTEVLSLLAFCVANTANTVRGDEGACAFDPLARAVGLDMREWWEPTAAAYLASVPKARILDVVTEAVSAETAASLGTLKKAALAQAAEQKLAGTGWLPAFLRSAA